MTEIFDIDKQIEEIQKEIAKYSQLLFEAQGMFRLAVHMKNNCVITPKIKEGELAPSRPAGQ